MFRLRNAVGRVLALLVVSVSPLMASEADLRIPDLSTKTFLGSIDGRTLLTLGLAVCVLGLIYGLIEFVRVKKKPVHKAMLEISELIYTTCKTYMITQGKFLSVLWVITAVIMVYYFGFLAQNGKDAAGMAIQGYGATKVLAILGCSVLGILGSYGVAWFGIRMNTFANSRTAFASLNGRPFNVHAIPLHAGMSIGVLLISVELLLLLSILLFVPADFAGPCFIGFAIGESLGAAALRIAGGIFTKIADIGSDLMKIVFKIKEDDARNPGVIADCVGDNAGDSVGPTADGFETYGVTAVALISLILLAVNPEFQVQLLVWVFAISIVMIIASLASFYLNVLISNARFKKADDFNFETPLSTLVWVTSLVSVGCTYLVSYLLIADLGGGSLWYQLATIISCGTLAGALIPEVVKAFTSTDSGHVREVVTASKEGGASLNILAGLTAGNFSGYWLGITIVALMGVSYFVALQGLISLMNPYAVAVFAFGLVAFGFLSMGPVTIAVDSYGPVTDNAQSVYELSLIEEIPNVKAEIKKDFGFDVNFDKAKYFLEANDSAGNTFKATSKPVLIGTAVVGATALIFSIILMLTNNFQNAGAIEKLSILHAPFLLGLITGGAIIYWFSGAATQAVSTGAYRAVEFIKANIKLENTTKASAADSKRVVEICTQYAQKGMFNIFLGVFFATLGFAFFNEYFFIGYLISIAVFGLYQAIFMANAGGAWDNAKKLVEVELKAKGTELHDATVVGDTVGDPFKDTSSVAMNPVIKFTTLFGLLAVELAVEMKGGAATARSVLAVVFFALSMFFVWRSFYKMRIKSAQMK